MKRLLAGGLIIVFCGVLIPTFVVADKEGEADTKIEELKQQIEEQKAQREQKLEVMKQEQEKIKENREGGKNN